MTLLELVQRAIDLASAGTATNVQQLAMEVAAEPLVQVVFDATSKSWASGEKTRDLLRQTLTLNFVSGTADLPANALLEYIGDSRLYDEADLTKVYSHIPWDQMVTAPLDPRLGYYSLETGGTIQTVEPNAVFQPLAGFTGQMRLTMPCAVVVPTLATDPVIAPAQVFPVLISNLAEALKQKFK